jgi:hypothetical protein
MQRLCQRLEGYFGCFAQKQRKQRRWDAAIMFHTIPAAETLMYVGTKLFYHFGYMERLLITLIA